MTELLLDPTTWLLAGFSVLVAVGAGRMRHESRLSIAMTAVGANAFLFGLRWAGVLGGEATGAAFLASGGMAMWSEAVVLSMRRSTAVAG